MKKRSIAACSTSSTCSDSSSLTSVESNPKRPKSAKPRKPCSRSKKGLLAPKTPPTRSSIYRGVTRHRWTGRFEAHLWDKETWNNVQTKKGRQVYLGAYDNEEAAAKTYDLAAIKYWGPETALNFPVETYQEEIEEMQKLTKEEYLATLRRRSSGFSRGVSKFRGVAKHHHNGRWEARIGRVLGNKYLYLGTYSTQEEAAAAYDRAAIQYRGANAVTNFDISNYADLFVKKDPMNEEEERARNAEQEAGNAAAQVADEPTQPPNLKHEADEQEDHEGKKGVVNMLDCRTKCEQAAYDTYANAEDSSTIGQMMVEDHGMINEHDLSWDLNLDPNFNELPIPNLSDISNSCHMECELPALFDDYIGFEDNLDFMFSPEIDNSLFDVESRDFKGTTTFTTTNPPTMTPSSSSSSISCLSMSPSVICEEDYLV